MTKPDKVKEKVFQLLREGLSAKKIINQLTRDPQWNREDLPTPKTIRNWRKQKSEQKQLLTEKEKKLARELDIRIFKESDQILSEGNVTFYTDQLRMPDWSFESKIIHKLAEYAHYFSLVEHKYINDRIRKSCDDFLIALEKAHDLQSTYYFLEGDRMVFMPVGYNHYVDGTDEEDPEYKRIAKQLGILAKKAYEAYIDYRKTVHNTLFV